MTGPEPRSLRGPSGSGAPPGPGGARGGTAPAVAVFVSPHGFGHAARASAVMAALHRRTGARFELFAATPRWFFDESVEGLYRHHEVSADVGFVQTSALSYDLERTVEAVGRMVPFDPGLVGRLADVVRRTECCMVLCDIAPLGIAVAERAGIPSALVQNFTWPWLYEPLFDRAPSLAALSREMDGWIGRASLHLLAEPFCDRDPRAHGVVLPVSRRPRRTREELREEAGLAPEERVVVLTMGGYGEEMPFLGRLAEMRDVTFLVTGSPATRVSGNLRMYDNATRLYMPHLVRMADAVVGKLGYSTVAEVWAEGRPAAWVTRHDFRETGPLMSWAAARIPGFEIPAAEFAAGAWVAALPALLDLPRPEPAALGGADQVVDHLVERFGALTE